MSPLVWQKVHHQQSSKFCVELDPFVRELIVFYYLSGENQGIHVNVHIAFQINEEAVSAREDGGVVLTGNHLTVQHKWLRDATITLHVRRHTPVRHVKPTVRLCVVELNV